MSDYIQQMRVYGRVLSESAKLNDDATWRITELIRHLVMDHGVRKICATCLDLIATDASAPSVGDGRCECCRDEKQTLYRLGDESLPRMVLEMEHDVGVAERLQREASDS